uniref:Glycosyltransferase N-terminal domain-containing protein n=1 Tax=Leersia perrieri TaxID=77586 RepID=A0A0D9VDK1_9ORYZ
MAPMEEEPVSATPPPPSPPHFVIVPLPAQGHTIPMVDLAFLLAERGARATLVVTPANASRLRAAAGLAARANLPLEIVELPFPPPAETGLPAGVENVDQVTDYAHFLPFFTALRSLASPLESYLRSLPSPPSCLISDWCQSWTSDVATRGGIPRLFFHGPSCFYSLCDLNAAAHGLQPQHGERFIVPGMPVRVEVTKETRPGFFKEPGWEAIHEASMEAMRTADGAVVNTFVGLESQFVSCYETALGKPVWALGPFSLYNRDADMMASRGNDNTSDVDAQTWLDEIDEDDSVIYVNFGSLARKPPKYLFEVGHGLEDSGKPFLWVVKESEVISPEVEQWMSAFVLRTATRGLVVRGWAPQLAILSHRAVGGFVTHCGWNSMLEAIAHGVPVVTWPHFADQFLNERLAVDVLGVGVPIGVTMPVMLFGDEAVPVTRGDVARAVSALMDGGEEGEERRRKAKEYGEKARRAMEKGGSSYESLTQLIDSFTLQAMETTEQASQPPPHFVLVPLAAHGHLLPMVDLARLLASRGVRVSLATTPLNVARLRGVADQAAREKLPLELVELPFSPSAETGLPPECQNADKIADDAQLVPLLNAMRDALAAPFDAYVRALRPKPTCVVSDFCNPWTAAVSRRLGIPRLFFQGPSCFYSLCDLKSAVHGLQDRIVADEHGTAFVVPGMPVHVTVTRGTAPGFYNAPDFDALRHEAMEAMRTADGAVVNTFADLEAQFVECYEATLGKPVWALGPFCLGNRDDTLMASCGSTVLSVDQRALAAWLDEQATGSVVYVNFGSLVRKAPAQLFEIGHGLEDSGKPFLWVVKESEATAATAEARDWLDAFVARTATRGVVVRGWAPQVAILSHRAVGGFVTHCGWNSLLEAVAHGVPVVTWPHFADQFLNEKLVVDVLGVGVPIGVTAPVQIMDDVSLPVSRRDVARAVLELMGDGEVANERRRKAKEYGEKARRAMEKGGSSYECMTQLIQSFMPSGVTE